MAKTIVAVAAVLVVIVAVFAVYAGLTYPRTVVTIPVSFTIGADSTTVSFEQPALADKVQVQVSVQNGAALWRAQILNGDEVVWEHGAGQGEQTSYNSGWLALPSGQYNFTFRMIGVGSLDATVTVSSKGGIW